MMLPRGGKGWDDADDTAADASSGPGRGLKHHADPLQLHRVDLVTRDRLREDRI